MSHSKRMFEPSPEKLLAMVDAAMAKFDRARECALRADREQAFERAVRFNRAAIFGPAQAVAAGCYPKPRDGGIFKF